MTDYRHSRDESLAEHKAMRDALKAEKKARLIRFVLNNPDISQQRVAKMFEVSTQTVNRWVKEGRDATSTQ